MEAAAEPGLSCWRRTGRGEADSLWTEGSRLDDYYAGAEGARRLMVELDHFLQQIVENVELAEALSCSIELEVAGGDVIPLKKTYRRRLEQAGQPALNAG